LNVLTKTHCFSENLARDISNAVRCSNLYTPLLLNIVNENTVSFAYKIKKKTHKITTKRMGVFHPALTDVL